MATDKKILQDPEPLVFIHECLPQLVAGEYTVKADLAVGAANAGDFETAEKKFWVGAPRFLLEDAAIYTLYPPKGIAGHFETTLPHIVFNRRTLPWERTIDGELHNDTQFKSSNPTMHAPWMALLLLSEEEMTGHAIIPAKKTLQDPGTDIFVPEIATDKVNGKNPKLAPWESIDTLYDVIDIPLPLFKQLMPAKDNLPYLAHVRKVLVDESKDSEAIGDDGYFATLIGNRLPVRAADKTKPMRNSVFLVSLEGLHNYYTTDNYIEKKGKQKVRLVVLQSWAFTVAPGKNFLELCQGLHVSPFKMNYQPNLDEAVKQAYDYGYTLLPHTTRDGSDSYSWYRGPFNPNFLPASPTTTLFKTADAALRFDHQTGLVDISYAAAWQLGRLLALKDKVFSTALYQWKVQGKKKVLETAAVQQINQLLPTRFNLSNHAGADPLEDQVKDFLASAYTREIKTEMVPMPFSNRPADVMEQMNTIADTDGTMPAPPKEITDWLGKLFLLNGVPINYLLPHEDYLISREDGEPAKEAVGMFYIDYNWMEALLGGALSIVATDDSVSLLNMLKDGRYLPDNLLVNKMNSAFVPVAEDEPVPLPPNIQGHITGYLLRSQLVSGWKGIKIFAKDETGNWMKFPLKIERIADDIQLCIFSGKLQQLLLIQPPEGVHFGLDGSAGAYQKKLRDATGAIGATAVSIQTQNGVLNLKTIADGMTAKGVEVKTSANLAFQMLESPVMYILNIDDHWKKQDD